MNLEEAKQVVQSVVAKELTAAQAKQTRHRVTRATLIRHVTKLLCADPKNKASDIGWFGINDTEEYRWSVPSNFTSGSVLIETCSESAVVVSRRSDSVSITAYPLSDGVDFMLTVAAVATIHGQKEIMAVMSTNELQDLCPTKGANAAEE